MSGRLISIVMPIYQEGNQIAANVGTVHRLLCDSGIHHEIILIDDGSRDNSWSEIKRLSHELPQVHGIKLSRNFGKESALCAGLEAVRGDACVVIDADLQHPPQLIPEMVRLWDGQGYEIVEGVKKSRGKENIANKYGAALFHKLMQWLSGVDVGRASDFKLLDRKVIDSWKRMGERNTFFRGMAAWMGFHRIAIEFEVTLRAHGRSKWSIKSLYHLAINAIASFSSLPLQFVTFLGLAFLAGSLIMGLETLYMKFLGGAVDGFTTVILLQLIIGSTLMISLGVIGTYIAKIYEEVKRRPRYLVSEETGHPPR